MSELNPCPFCETVVEYPALHEDANEAIMFHPRPEKGECILGGYSYGFDPEQWRKRPGEEALQAKIDRLEIELASKEGFSDAPF